MNTSFGQPYILRLAKPNEASALIDLQYNAIERYRAFPRVNYDFDVALLEKNISQMFKSNYVCVVGFDQKNLNKPLGYMTYQKRLTDLYIEDLYALKNPYSLGEKLFTHTKLVAAKTNLQSICLDCLSGPEDLYYSWGFKRANTVSDKGQHLILKL